MRTPHRWTTIAGMFLTALLPLAASGGTPGGDEAGPRGPQPSGEPILGGDLEALQDLLARDVGRPVLLNFWATWCVPCVREMPALNALHETYGPRGLRTLAVSLDAFVYADQEARRKVFRMVSERSFRLPIFLFQGEQDGILEAFDLPGALPHTLLLGPDGAVADRVEGAMEPEELERLERRIESLLRPTGEGGP